MARPRGQRAATFVVGIVALVAGVALSLREHSASFGWFAYTPLTTTGDMPRFVTNEQLFAWAVAGAGLVLLAGCVGYFLGSRSAGPTPDQRQPTEPN